jgi:hypothetical protein
LGANVTTFVETGRGIKLGFPSKSTPKARFPVEWYLRDGKLDCKIVVGEQPFAKSSLGIKELLVFSLLVVVDRICCPFVWEELDLFFDEADSPFICKG